MKFRVVDETWETPLAKTLLLESCSGEHTPFISGQFYSFEFSINGTTFSRCYSISCSEKYSGYGRISITIKKVNEGKVSSHILRTSMTGSYIGALGPFGSFNRTNIFQGPVLLVAAGSGITPIYSMIESWSESEHRFPVSLVYFNTSVENTIFYDSLLKIQQRATEFSVHFVFTHSFDNSYRARSSGMLVVREFLDMFDECSIAVCGPESFMEQVFCICRSSGAREERLFKEAFIADTAIASGEDKDKRVAVIFPGPSKTVYIDRGKTVFDAAVEAGVSIKRVCGVGACAECKVKLTSGAVEMSHLGGLSQSDEASGYILACCSRLIANISVETPTA